MFTTDPTAEVLDAPDPDQEAGTGDTAVLGQGVHTDLADHASTYKPCLTSQISLKK